VDARLRGGRCDREGEGGAEDMGDMVMTPADDPRSGRESAAEEEQRVAAEPAARAGPSWKRGTLTTLSSSRQARMRVAAYVGILEPLLSSSAPITSRLLVVCVCEHAPAERRSRRFHTPVSTVRRVSVRVTAGWV
jgi:hypothetical protein